MGLEVEHMFHIIHIFFHKEARLNGDTRND